MTPRPDSIRDAMDASWIESEPNPLRAHFADPPPMTHRERALEVCGLCALCVVVAGLFFAAWLAGPVMLDAYHRGAAETAASLTGQEVK